MPVNLRALVGKLDERMRSAMEAAAGLCLARTHYNIEIEHFLLKALDSTDTDFAQILRRFEVDKSRLTSELTRSMDRLKTGNARTPAFSPSLLRMLSEAWTIGSLDFAEKQIRTGIAILALVSDDELSRLIRDISRELQKIDAGVLKKEFSSIIEGSVENAGISTPTPDGSQEARPPGAGKTPNLDQFTIDLTENAQSWKDRSGAGPRFRDPPGDRHSDAPPPEQSDPHWRGGRRQNRRGRRLRAALSRRRCSAAFAKCHASHAGPGAAAGRRRRQGRIREPPQGPDRRSQVLAHCRSFSSSTKPTP